jgi:hypothetical protein
MMRFITQMNQRGAFSQEGAAFAAAGLEGVAEGRAGRPDWAKENYKHASVDEI